MRYSGVSTTIANATIFLSPEEVEVVKVSVQKSDSSVELKKITYLSALLSTNIYMLIVPFPM